jgi:sugar phosphate isomerase/epimerase
MYELGIEHISTFGMPPVELVGLAADLGCACIGIALTPINDYNPHGYPDWSLRDDAALRRETLAAMRDRGVSIGLAGGFHIWPGREARDLARDIDLFCELGATRINTSGYERDLGRCFDEFATLVEMASARGLETMLEFGPEMAVADLAGALAAQRHVGRPEFRLLIDTMHVVRAGAGAANLAALDPKLIGYLQLCDAPLARRYASHLEESKYERMAPGTGELPLLEVVKALPRNLVVGLEIPIRSLAEAGVGPHERLAPCVAATRRLLAQAAQ